MTDEVDLTYDVIKMFSAWQDPESKNDKLLEAASEGKSRLVRGLLLSGASLEHRNAGYDQALHIAARKGHNAVISVLILEYGANINSRGNYEFTALINAADAGPPSQHSEAHSRGGGRQGPQAVSGLHCSVDGDNAEKPDNSIRAGKLGGGHNHYK